MANNILETNMQPRRRQLTAALLCAIAAPSATLAEDLGAVPSLAGAVTWLNSPPLTPNELRGKVVLVQFWTYSCINWLRSMPAVRGWVTQYGTKGLVVVGVHTPEFEFEKDLDNVRRATREMHIDYPVAVDSRSAIWRAFGNEYWPALYFVDALGRIRHRHFGEGDAKASERVLRQLLKEAGVSELGPEAVPIEGSALEVAADWINLKSDEKYLGGRRTTDFASPGGLVADRRRTYTAPSIVKLNAWALSGEWTVTDGFAVSAAPGARIAYRFHARDLHLVMGPRPGAAPVRFRVLVDGLPPGADHGVDVDEQGLGTMAVPRLHQLLRQRKSVADRLFEIEFVDPGAQAYSFTFG